MSRAACQRHRHLDQCYPLTEHTFMCVMRQTQRNSTLLGRLLTRVRYPWTPTMGFVIKNRENCDEKSTEIVFDHLKGKLVSEKEEERS